jgi:Mlc titration factor MtfA (ptsG expression regulator)
LSDYYNSVFTKQWHKGEVNPGFRVIAFSWRGIAEGMKVPDDGINLLLHEFAHALWLEHKLVGHQYKVLDPHWVEQFEKYAEHEMANLNANEKHFFRKYAFENIEEFFAVAVENFSELYRILAHLFKQDPLTLHAPGTKQKPLFS